jgi:hypothetical protein
VRIPRPRFSLLTLVVTVNVIGMMIWGNMSWTRYQGSHRLWLGSKGYLENPLTDHRGKRTAFEMRGFPCIAQSRYIFFERNSGVQTGAVRSNFGSRPLLQRRGRSVCFTFVRRRRDLGSGGQSPQRLPSVRRCDVMVPAALRARVE